MHKKLLLGIMTMVGLATLAGGPISATQAASTSSTKITAAGSTALQPLVEQAANSYQQKDSQAQINVQGGGSGAGLSQVSEGSITIGDSDVFAEQQAGLNAKKLVDHKVAVVGIAPVVNKKTGVTNLTKAQLLKIFQKKVTNWKQVGGKNQKITVINRAQGSGTRTTFEGLALGGQKASTSLEQDSSGTVQKMVGSTPGAISYLAFSYLTGNKNVKAVSVNGVKPTTANLTTNKWTIWSYEHMYTKGAPDYNTAKFIHFIQSSSFQKAYVKKLGYIPINQMKVERTAQGKINDVKP